jgi:probable HAF family extracellular repeat protein
MADLGSLGGAFGVVNWMNQRGQVVGRSDLKGDSTFHPYLSENGKPMRDLGTLGGDNGEAYSINDSGVVVGRADEVGNAAHHAFLWKAGEQMKDLGVPDGDTCSTALSINAQDQVVGDSGICGVGGHAFLWEEGGMVNLQDLVIPGSALQVTEADYINDRGEIACIGTLPDGNSHACLLIPSAD